MAAAMPRRRTSPRAPPNEPRRKGPGREMRTLYRHPEAPSEHEVPAFSARSRVLVYRDTNPTKRKGDGERSRAGGGRFCLIAGVPLSRRMSSPGLVRIRLSGPRVTRLARAATARTAAAPRSGPGPAPLQGPLPFEVDCSCCWVPRSSTASAPPPSAWRSSVMLPARPPRRRRPAMRSCCCRQQAACPAPPRAGDVPSRPIRAAAVLATGESQGVHAGQDDRHFLPRPPRNACSRCASTRYRRPPHLLEGEAAVLVLVARREGPGLVVMTSAKVSMPSPSASTA